jgi:UTP--glucose-1-phosphate uridylyltransferase
MKALIPAAGRGTRFLPATKAQPKEMLPVLAKPTIQYVVEEALAAGASEVVLISNRQKQCIQDHFSPDEALVSVLTAAGKDTYAEDVRFAGSLPVSYVEQDHPLGLGHAIHCAADKVLGVPSEVPAALAPSAALEVAPPPVPSEAPAPGVAPPLGTPAPSEAPQPFYVLLGDVLVPDHTILPRMLSVSKEHDDASVIAVFRVPREQVSRFGIIAGEPIAADVWRVCGLVEKPPQETAPSELAIFGRYLLTPKVMELLAHTAPGAGGEIQLTDALIELLDHEELYALIIDQDEGFDVGTIESWLLTNLRLAQRDPALAAALPKSTFG